MAALTIPVLIQKHQEQVTVNKVKKFYSTMNQAHQRALNDNGTLEQWGMKPEHSVNPTGSEKLMSYYKPYLLLLKDCGAVRGCIGHKENVKGLNKYNGWSMNYDMNSVYYKFILNDGSAAWLRSSGACTVIDGGWSNVCGVLWYDVDGAKGRTQLGYDVFTFIILKDRIVPYIVDDCNLNSAGWGCSSYIILNRNMDYLHKKD